MMANFTLLMMIDPKFMIQLQVNGVIGKNQQKGNTSFIFKLNFKINFNLKSIYINFFTNQI